MAQFWVVGGEFTDTSFQQLAPGKALERHGPYASYRDAYKVWQERAWKTVDDCNYRFRVLEGSDAGPGEGPSVIEGVPPPSE